MFDFNSHAICGLQVYKYEEVDVGFGWKDAGYFQRFNDTNIDAITARLRVLQTNRWVDPATRFLRIDFVTYNPNIGLFVLVVFNLELLNSGRFLATYDSEVLPATFYYTWTDLSRMAVEIVVVVLWAVKVVLAARDHLALAAERRRSLRDQEVPEWRVPLMLMTDVQLVFFVVLFGLWGRIVGDPTLASAVVTRDAIAPANGGVLNFIGLALVFRTYWVMNGVNVLLSVLLVLCYLNLNSGISQLSAALHIMAGNLLQFGFVLFMLMATFMLMAHLLFGHLMPEFSQLDQSLLSLFDIFLGGGDYFALEDVDNIGAPLFYYPFLFVMVFVVFNVTIAIIMDGYVVMQETRAAARRGDFAAVIDLSVWAQAARGAMRAWPLHRCLPARWRRITPAGGGLPQDRFEGPQKREVLRILKDFIAESGRCLPLDELKAKLAGRNVTEQVLNLTDTPSPPSLCTLPRQPKLRLQNSAIILICLTCRLSVPNLSG